MQNVHEDVTCQVKVRLALQRTCYFTILDRTLEVVVWRGAVIPHTPTPVVGCSDPSGRPPASLVGALVEGVCPLR